MRPEYFQDDRHTLYVGWVCGIALRNGVPLEPIYDDDGNHTNRLRLKVGNGTITLAVPYPPDDWSLVDSEP